MPVKSCCYDFCFKLRFPNSAPQTPFTPTHGLGVGHCAISTPPKFGMSYAATPSTNTHQLCSLATQQFSPWGTCHKTNECRAEQCLTGQESLQCAERLHNLRCCTRPSSLRQTSDKWRLDKNNRKWSIFSLWFRIQVQTGQEGGDFCTPPPLFQLRQSPKLIRSLRLL